MNESPLFVVRTSRGVAARVEEGGSLRLGRRPDGNDVVLEDHSVSRFHARLRWPHGHAACVDDLGSANGTFVDERLVRRSARLEDVCMLRLGSVEISVELQHPALIADDGELACRLFTDHHRSDQVGELTPPRGLAHLLDLERRRRTGTLHLEDDRAGGRILLAAGRIVQAHFGRERGAAALGAMLHRFTRASLRLAPDVEPGEGSVSISLRVALAQGSVVAATAW